ncbi:MAG: cupredoxin domain-containing protein [Nitrospira sp.]|nr:cupredoxin domain-containing protein [Nitrospira sp.]
MTPLGPSRTFLQISPLLCFVTLLVSPISTQPILLAPSPQIAIQAEPPFFSPNHLTIRLDTALTWKNHTQEAHSIVADDCRSRSQCSFDSGVIRPDHQFVLPRLDPGHYPYHCGLHPFMRGLLTIYTPHSPSSAI